MSVILRNGNSVPSIETDESWEKISNTRYATKPHYPGQTSPQDSEQDSASPRGSPIGNSIPRSPTRSPPPSSAYAIKILGLDMAMEFDRLWRKAKSSQGSMHSILNGPVPMIFSFSFMPEDIIGCPTAYFHNIANPRPKRAPNPYPPMPFLMVDRVTDLVKTGYTVFMETATKVKLVELDYRARAQPKIYLWRYHDGTNAMTSVKFNSFFKWTKKNKESPLRARFELADKKKYRFQTRGPDVDEVSRRDAIMDIFFEDEFGTREPVADIIRLGSSVGTVRLWKYTDVTTLDELIQMIVTIAVANFLMHMDEHFNITT